MSCWNLNTGYAKAEYAGAIGWHTCNLEIDFGWHCALPVGNFGTFPFSSLASRCLPVLFYLWYRNQSTRARGKLNSRVGSVGRGYFETRWPQFVPPESADQAIAKVLPFPAPTDCKSADECVPRDNWFEGSAGHARS
jgi:hypothetical protein